MDTLNPYDPEVTAETFDLAGYLSNIRSNPLIQTSEGRRLLTKLDPFLFAVLYLTKHMLDANGKLSVADAHLVWARKARYLATPSKGPGKHRDMYVAPRSTGKSTWWFLLIPMWAAAHGHVKFIAAFAHGTDQAETHLQSFKTELQTNVMLREDYPLLCSPLTKAGTNYAVSDNRSAYQAKSEFVFMAKGIDAGNLGMKVGAQRPDFIVLDDIEPGESNYSAYQMEGRRSTLLNVVLPLNEAARIAFVGTVTMPGSIVHQLVKYGKGTASEDEIAWIKPTNFKVHHAMPIVQREDGTERSIWPEKWPLEFLQEMRNTRSFLLNYENNPLGMDGAYWTASTFQYKEVPALSHKLLSIDPAVTSKASSDYTGIAVVAYSATNRTCQVQKAVAVKMQPDKLRTYVLQMLEADPQIGRILIETNQGGDVWKGILHDMPVEVVTVHQTVKKEVRAAALLSAYERGWVQHVPGLVALEEQMVGFPKAPNDDIVDAVGSGVAYFLTPKNTRRVGITRTSGY